MGFKENIKIARARPKGRVRGAWNYADEVRAAGGQPVGNLVGG
jgi:hypothetical protein